MDFYPENIVRLYLNKERVFVANNGCSENLKDKYIEFGYRNNLISGEMFFSDGIFLVEGYSEVIFYTELFQQIGIDLDYCNIRIIPVFGIGFESYINLLKALCIPFVLRTDNDITISKAGKNTFSGLNRLINISNKHFKTTLPKIEPHENGDKPENFETNLEPILDELAQNGLFLSAIDLEEDLCEELTDVNLFNDKDFDSESLKKFLKQKKATNMFNWIYKGVDLTGLTDSKIIEPLYYLLFSLGVYND